ncbi:MAG: ATPase [Polyangiales bacterium]
MTKSSALRVVPSAAGVSIWSAEIFGDSEASGIRDFLSRAFSVGEVQGVELRRAKAFGRIHYAKVGNPARIWRKLSLALRGAEAPADEVAVGGGDARGVYLSFPTAAQVHVTRVGDALTTWRVRGYDEESLQLAHPLLRNRRDVVFRLEEELASILGVERVRASTLTGGVSIRFDKRALSAGGLARELEKAWPKLLEGLDGPPSRTRLAAAVGLAGLAFTGQYVAPVVRPFAVAGVALYSAPNLLNAAKELRRGEVGLSTLYSTGLVLMLVSGMPFASTVMATLMQLWPQLGHSKVVRSQRRLFAEQRRRPTSAWRASEDGSSSVQVSLDALRPDDRIVVSRGDVIPVDGVVDDGIAAILAQAPFGNGQIEDISRGDVVAAGARVVDGRLTIRVERIGDETAARYVESLLPPSRATSLPAAQEVERVANRNAKYALSLAAAGFLLTRTLRVSQGIIRPDYATAPRLSAQLVAVQGFAQALAHGALFRNLAALDRLDRIDVYVIDDTVDLERRRLEVTAVQAVNDVPASDVLGYAAAALASGTSERAQAVLAFAARKEVSPLRVKAAARLAGAWRFRDAAGHTVELVTTPRLRVLGLDVPKGLQRALAPASEGRRRRAKSTASIEPEQPSTQPVWVLRDGEVVGAITFARTGGLIAQEVLEAIQARQPKARVVYLSRHKRAAAEKLARIVGIEVIHADLGRADKVDFLRGLEGETLWIGDGAHPDAREPIAASTVSISVSARPHVGADAADVLLPYIGLAGVPAVLDVGRAHQRRLAKDYRTVYVANVLGVAGAFVARFGGLQSGLLSNLGTALVYARHARALDRRAAVVEATRNELKLLAPA